MWEKARRCNFLWKRAMAPPYFASGIFPDAVFTSRLGLWLCSEECLEQVCLSAALFHTPNNPTLPFSDVSCSPLEVRVLIGEERKSS